MFNRDREKITTCLVRVGVGGNYITNGYETLSTYFIKRFEEGDNIVTCVIDGAHGD